MKDQTIHTHTFENGLTVVVEPMADLQSAAFSLLVPGGGVHDPSGREGCAGVLCDLISRGAGERDSRELTAALDFLGVQRHESVERKFMSFNGAMLADNLDETLQIYADMIRRPHLPADEFEPVLSGAEQSLRAIDDEPRQKVMLELRRRCYPTPWGLPSEGTLEGLAELTPELICEQYARTFRPNGAIFGIAGHVDSTAVIDQIGKLFGDWEALPDPIIELGPRGVFRDHIPHDSTQTQIGIAYDSVPYNDPDYYAAWAAVGVLSGGSSSRLFTEVRERRGLCYSVYATLHGLRDTGRVLCYAGTTVERAQETLDVTLGELLRLEQGIQPDELERCKARAKSSLIMQQESSSSRA